MLVEEILARLDTGGQKSWYPVLVTGVQLSSGSLCPSSGRDHAENG